MERFNYRKIPMANKEKKSRQPDDTDFGLIIKARRIKRYVHSDQMNEMDYMPRKLCNPEDVYGMDIAIDSVTSLMRRERKRNS